MTDGNVIVLDAGSSSIRCHLVNSRNRIIASTSRPWTYLQERDAPELARAFDHDACWQSARDAIIECANAIPADCDGISAVAITSQRQSLVFLDESGDSIYAGPNTDLRAVFEGFALHSRHGDSIIAFTGGRPSFMTAIGKLAWFRDHRPDDYNRIAYALTIGDWLAFKLTGNIACERTLASESGLTDVNGTDPTPTLLERLDLRAPVPPIQEALSLRGEIVESLPGVPNGVPVVNAGADTQCGLIGVGVVDCGSAGIVAGWSATVQSLSSGAPSSRNSKIWSGLFQLPGLRTVESNAGDMGNSLQWIANLLFENATNPYLSLSEAARTAAVGSDAVSAFLGPQAMDSTSLSMRLGGLTFPTPMSLGGPTKAQIARATLESFAYALRANLEQAEKVAGFRAQRIGLAGGITRLPVFNEIVTDVLGREVSLSSTPDATALGAALVARTAIGQEPSLREAAICRSLNNARLDPNRQNALEYQDRYREWLHIQRDLGKMLS